MKRNPNIIGTVHFLNLFVLGFCLSLGTGMNAQIGGNHTFSFLNLPNSARVTALGSSTIATQDDDITLGLQSPSLLNKSMHQSFGLNHNFHLADISFGSAAYGHHLDKWGVSTMLGITYLSYGDFRRTNEFAEIIGEFTGGDIAFTLGASKKWNDRITTGVNLKWANSRLDNYSSSGIGLDIGVTYAHPEKSKLYTLVFKNVGLQYSPFDNETEAFPLDVQIGTSRRLKYLPLRISFILHDLNNWNIRSDGIEEDQTIFIDQEPTEQSPLSKGISNFCF